MEKTFVYKPSNVCSMEMDIVYDDQTMEILSYNSIRGCVGNSQGLGALIRGMKVEEALNRLRGIQCPGSRTRMTSCPDQLSYALEEVLRQEGKID